MFTGLIEEVGTLVEKRLDTSSAIIKIAAKDILESISIGDSISCSGVCLTVIAFNDRSFSADISFKTLERTTFITLGSGSMINLERALKLSDRLGGHIVLGHVDTIAKILAIESIGSGYRISISLDREIDRYIASKGSITVDGISLTVSALFEDRFDIAVIPHTFASTTLLKKRVGDVVNIEVDIISRYLERLIGKRDDCSTDERILKLLKEF